VTAIDTTRAGDPMSAIPRRYPSRRRALRRTHVMAAVFVIPALALMVVFLVVPVIQNVQYSFTNWNGITAPVWIGLSNYTELLSDSLFHAVLTHTLELAVVGTLAATLVGLLWAYGIERRLPGWRVYRFTLFIPVVMPITVSGLLWSLLLQGEGPINAILGALGWQNPPVWLGDPTITMWVVIAVSVWQASGFTMLLLLSGMEDVPRELHEAASLDGANSLRRLVSIVIPQIRGTMAVVAVLQFISLLKAFDIVFAMTRGGPGNATDVLGTYLYEKAFAELRWGYGSTVAVVMTVVLFCLSFVLYRILLGREKA